MNYRHFYRDIVQKEKKKNQLVRVSSLQTIFYSLMLNVIKTNEQTKNEYR